MIVKTEVKTKDDQNPLSSSYNPGRLIYRQDKDNKYQVKVTWTWANNGNQVVEVMSDETTMNIIDTCHVFYDTLNDETTASTDDEWILNDAEVTTTCDRGYILPKLTDGSARDYVYTCAVDNDIKFTKCEGGNIVKDAPEKSTYTFDDNAKLAISGGTTVHKGTVATITCDSDFTLRKAWSKTTVCNEPDAAPCSFDGDCVIGCKYTLNGHTKTPYVTDHDNSLVADQDSYTYQCIPGCFVPTGATQYTETC